MAIDVASGMANEVSDPRRQSPARARLIAWLDSLGSERLDGLARRYARAAAEGGATMLKPDGRALPIPPLLTPEILDTERLAAVERNAHAITDGLARVARWLMTDRGAELRARLFRAFGPLEQEALARTHRDAERLATVRVDYLIDGNDREHALEVNTTIPAMQGYSDLVARAFLHEVARERGLGAAVAERLLDDNGRNADQLLASLLAHDRRLRGAPDAGADDASVDDTAARTIALVARPGDSQIGELRYLAQRFSALGHPSYLATPDQVRLAGDRLLVDGREPDLVYRHVFARRLDPASDFARACLQPARFHIFNPVSSHLEVKGVLGLLSQAGATDGNEVAVAVDLTDEVRAEVQRSVPWTRVLLPGPARGPDGAHVADLVAAVIGEQPRFVLKRSWDYGGRSVFLGADHDDEGARRAAEVMDRPREALDWPALVRAACDDPRDSWVVQEFVPGATRRHLVAGDDGARWRDLFVDLSVFTNLGVAARPRGGVTRASQRRIVNLQGGGGLAPLVRSDVIDRLLQEPDRNAG